MDTKQIFTEPNIFCDLVINTNDNCKLYYSKFVLCTCSDYFLKLVTFNNIDKKEIYLDISSHTLSVLLNCFQYKLFRKLNIQNNSFIYTINDILKKNISYIFELADFIHEIMLDDLLDIIINFIKDHMDLINELFSFYDIISKIILYNNPDHHFYFNSSIITFNDFETITVDMANYILKHSYYQIEIIETWCKNTKNIELLHKLNINWENVSNNDRKRIKKIILKSNDPEVLHKFIEYCLT